MIDAMLASLMTEEDVIWMLHCQGLAPSEIAEKLGTTEDVARAVVVARWADDRERHVW